MTKKAEYKIATGKTIKLNDETLSMIESVPRMCIIGDWENAIVDKDINGKPNYGETICSTKTSEEKQKLLFSFVNRFPNPKLATHFIVPITQKEYYKEFTKNIYKTEYDFISRVRKEVVYTIGFIPSLNNASELEKDIEILKGLKAESEDSIKQLTKMSEKYVWLAKVYNMNGTEAKNLIKQGINIIDSEKYKDYLGDVCASNLTFTFYGNKDGYFNPKNFIKNFKKSMGAFAQGFSNGGKALKYDFILMNPPYNVGGKITKATLPFLTDDGKCVCLMPLAQYEGYAKETDPLYRYIKSFELANNEMFEDADIGPDLAVTVLSKNIVDTIKSYQLLRQYSYNELFRPYYKAILNTKEKHITDIGKLCISTKDIIDWNDTFIYSERTPDISVGVQGDNASDYKFNNSPVCISIDEVAKPRKSSGQYTLIAAKFPNRVWLNNFVKWYYSNRKNGLANKVVVGLNKNGGTIIDAIPQIDWETISDHPLWRDGDYDGAVLDVMGLKWNEDKTGVVEK